ncbi:unnamed protein product [Meganyctiphanes norvegica]|uniref:Integral membrane protein 2 n=1 Tax=Meganyctiphanes norvegica TaxID=48144 RepID=A0AAV2PQH7_MEGNR
MTVITKPISEKGNKEKPLEKPLVVNEVQAGSCVEAGVVDPHNNDIEAWLTSSARRRVSTATTVCVFITALLVLSVGIVGGVYLYRQFSRHQMSRFRGWCGIPYERDSLHLMGNPRLPLGGNPAVYKGESDAEWTGESLFKEEFELDLDEEFYEKIHVPDFGFGRQGRFVHDFKTNMTGIIDMTSRRCFVMPLDRSHVLPPRTLFDLIKKMWMGYYNVDTEIVRETMKVVYPPVEDRDSLGMYINKHCANYPVYRLQRINVPDMKKRSVHAEGAEVDFVEFAGKNVVHFILVDEQAQPDQQQ